MKYTEAHGCLIEQRRVRRAEWKPGRHWKLTDLRFVDVDAEGKESEASMGETLSDDWELYQPVEALAQQLFQESKELREKAFALDDGRKDAAQGFERASLLWRFTLHACANRLSEL